MSFPRGTKTSAPVPIGTVLTRCQDYQNGSFSLSSAEPQGLTIRPGGKIEHHQLSPPTYFEVLLRGACAGVPAVCPRAMRHDRSRPRIGKSPAMRFATLHKKRAKTVTPDCGLAWRERPGQESRCLTRGEPCGGVDRDLATVDSVSKIMSGSTTPSVGTARATRHHQSVANFMPVPSAARVDRPRAARNRCQ